MEAPETVQLRRRSPIGRELRIAEDLHRRAQSAGLALVAALRENRALPLQGFEVLSAEMTECSRRNPSALSYCTQSYNEDGYTHSMGTGALMILVASHLRMSEDQIFQAGTAGLLHDIGNFHVSSELLNKPGALTPEEFRLVAQHTMHGYRLLSQADTLPSTEVRDSIRHHHERLDGTGYPDRLEENDIPPLTRMTAIADAYDALTRNRPFHKALASPKALAVLRQAAQGRYDRAMLDGFIECIGPFPAGSLVRLASQRLAVIVEQRHEDQRAPLVDAFYDIATHRSTTIETIDLAERVNERIVAVESAADWDINLGLQLRKSATLH
jgi:HD-GYP domain-containing protein (c-di-GMP phosphodiesterase class II)